MKPAQYFVMLAIVALALVKTSLGQEQFVLAEQRPGQYDPLQVDSNQPVETLEFEIEYLLQNKKLLRSPETKAQSRKVPVKIYLPSANSKVPVVLFSHGLGGSREGFGHGGQHWAMRGYIAVFIQHPGSDESVWRERALGERMDALRDAASLQNLVARIGDVKAVIDFLESIDLDTSKTLTQAPQAKQLTGRMDLQHIGMSGHSFGAITTQMVAGQSSIVPTQQTVDSRIKAAVVLSPSAPKRGQAERYFGKVEIPWLLMTGTKDNSPIGDQTAESRLAVFPALPAGSKYQAVFDGGTHAFLGERANLLSENAQQTNHANATIALSTAFWDAFLRGDESAKTWLNGSGPQNVLSLKDRWEKK